MATGFIGKDEKLTKKDKRVISAFRDKFQEGSKGRSDQVADVQTERTGQVVDAAFKKLKRLKAEGKKVVDDKEAARKARVKEAVRKAIQAPRGPNPTESEQETDRRDVESRSGVRRKRKLSDE